MMISLFFYLSYCYYLQTKLEYNQRSFTLLTLSICFLPYVGKKEDQILACRYISFENKVRNHITHLHYLQCQRQRLIYFICGDHQRVVAIVVSLLVLVSATTQLRSYTTLNVSLCECLYQSLHYAKIFYQSTNAFFHLQKLFLVHMVIKTK